MLKLEKMELHGFKSFNERTQILFDEGVTAVVGPNGCGKSNILDAMSWVLGEQSAKTLRGSAMIDLIFNGSERRKPLGMAEVTLRLRATNGDLPDGKSQVDVTRRLLRSGESGYLLNGTPCRLKDIHELLYGSGLGVRAYSFIEQNRIGAILQAKPLDRRALIEEAAGVTKFRAKKREAELKLDAARQNLERVRDIVAEIEKQMASLKRQASKARRYERVRTELRATLRELYARDHDQLRARGHDAIERFRLAAEERVKLTNAVTRTEAEVEALRLQIEKQESAVRSSADRLHECELEVDRNRHVIVNGRERLEELDARARELQEGLVVSRARHAELAAELKVKREEAEKAARREIEAREVLAGQRQQRDEAETQAGEAEAELEARRGSLLVEMQRSALLASAAEARLRLAEQLEQQAAAAAAAEGAGVRQERAAIALALECRDDVARAEAQVAELGDNVRTGFAEAQEYAVRRDQARGRVEEQRQSFQSKEERARALDGVVRAAEDAGEATATATIALGERSHGLVADLLRSDIRYERAVGAALEPLLGALVLSDAQALVEVLGVAQEEDRGVLRLLLVERQSGAVAMAHPQAERARSEPGVLGLLAECVTLGDLVAPALAPLVERTVLVENIDAALRLRDVYPQLSFVTSSGAVVTPDGLVRAGSRSGPGLLALRREGRELEEELVAVAEQLEGEAAAFGALQSDADDAEAAARAAVDSLHTAEKQLLEAQHRAANAEAERRKQSESLRACCLERERLELERAACRTACGQDEIELGRAEDVRRATDAAIDTARGAIETARARVAEVSELQLAAEAEFARSEEAHKAARAHIGRLALAVEERGKEMAALEEDRRTSLDRGAGLAREVEEAEEALTGLFATVAALKDRVRNEEDAARVLRHDLQQREAGLKEVRHRAELQRERVQEIEIERTKIDGELQRLAERSREDLGLELDDLGAEPLDANAQPALAAEPDEGVFDEASEGAGCHAVEVDVEAPEAIASGDDGAEAGVAAEEEGALDAEARDERASRTVDLKTLTTDDLRRRTAELKVTIGRIGPVNELAVQEYEELRGRDEYMSAQVTDLTESIESLVSTINRINRTTRERFRDAYDHIAKNFADTFQILFGGGRAELRLTDEDNMLETGIDIVAQPPGKRLQNILLLSGGEKALTAIALLFALFRYKPSPFCILDEVDAPLDEKNIDRFAGLLRTMSAGTQFILITHSPRTMKVADTLYGVTMEEPGVSRLVSVNFSEARA